MSEVIASEPQALVSFLSWSVPLSIASRNIEAICSALQFASGTIASGCFRSLSSISGASDDCLGFMEVLCACVVLNTAGFRDGIGIATSAAGSAEGRTLELKD